MKHIIILLFLLVCSIVSFADVEFIIWVSSNGSNWVGDIVGVKKPNGWTGKEEKLPKFAKITIKGITLDEAQTYIDSSTKTLCSHYLPISGLSTAIKNIILSTGTYTFTKAQFVSYITKK